MNIWKVILATVVIFSTGVITGGLVARKTYAPAVTQESHSVTNRPNQGFRPDRRLRRDFLARVGKELDLTPEQTQQVEAILRDSQERTRKLWEQISPQMRAEFKATRERIQEVLTPEQQQQFDALMQQRHPPRGENRARREPGSGGDRREPPRPPPPPEAKPPGA